LRLRDASAHRPGGEFSGLSGEIRPGTIAALALERRADAELLLQCAAGFELPDAGAIEMIPGAGAERDGPLAAHAAFVPARPALFAGTVLDNISLFDERLRPRARALAAEIGLTAITDRLPRGLLTEVGYEALDALSAGAVKRIGIVRALVREPGLLALQSPARSLDADGVERLAAMLEARRGSMTVLLASADQQLVALADTAIRVEGGKFEILARRPAA